MCDNQETSYVISALAPDQIDRVFEIDRSERIERKYIPRLAEDGLSIRAELRPCTPPEIFENWDAEGRRLRGHWWRRELDKGGALFAAEFDNRIVGFAIRGPVQASNASAEIVAMFVDAAWRGQGVGRELLAALEQNARDHGATAMHAGVNPTDSTVKFYGRAGYRIVALVDESQRPWGLTETPIVMAKLLTTQISAARATCTIM